MTPRAGRPRRGAPPRPLPRAHAARRLGLAEPGAVAQWAEEANDCSVVALALLLDLDYGTAWRKLALLGRTPRRGFSQVGMMVLLSDLGCGIGSKYRTVGELCRSRPRGRFLVCVAGHFAVVEDSFPVLRDLRPRQRIRWFAWHPWGAPQ